MSGKTIHIHGWEGSILTGGSYPQSDLQVHCNPHLNPSKHSNTNWQAAPKDVCGMQRTWNSQNTFEK